MGNATHSRLLPRNYPFTHSPTQPRKVICSGRALSDDSSTAGPGDLRRRPRSVASDGRGWRCPGCALPDVGTGPIPTCDETTNPNSHGSAHVKTGEASERPSQPERALDAGGRQPRCARAGHPPGRRHPAVLRAHRRRPRDVKDSAGTPWSGAFVNANGDPSAICAATLPPNHAPRSSTNT